MKYRPARYPFGSMNGERPRNVVLKLVQILKANQRKEPVISGVVKGDLGPCLISSVCLHPKVPLNTSAHCLSVAFGAEYPYCADLPLVLFSRLPKKSAADFQELVFVFPFGLTSHSFTRTRRMDTKL